MYINLYNVIGIITISGKLRDLKNVYPTIYNTYLTASRINRY